MEGEFTFSIYDKSLNFDEISHMLSTVPSNITRNGELLAKLNNRQAPFDSWHITEKFSENVAPEEALALLVQKLLPYREQISKLKQQYETVRLNAYLRSDYGQMGMDFPPETVRALGELGLGLSVHILSFGGVEA
ncbi:hypothetical protein A3842_18820 [Paenibacillus sp. P3E]|uniref:DUF4279 domain-containing protein n=1 Tax=Paenibacillus sp. P3E TaxID=1349435 RepID=UPI00093CC5E6|nr:DUF4279 domain-containing protein [Paenibacillus sp. P3E]OKP76019.1 hypothetical protein A3842_18820 [Paenibacillus sp. P3E]